MKDAGAKEARATLVCPACKGSLYLKMRILETAWQCPACLVKHPDIRTMGSKDYAGLHLRN